MPICSYLVIPQSGASERVQARLAHIPECEVVAARNRNLLILVTETAGLEEEEELRRRVESMDGIEALLLTFGEIDPDADIADPVHIGRGATRNADDRASSLPSRPAPRRCGEAT